MAKQRALVPRSIMALFCTVLQVCFGTVYAWSFFQTLLVRQLGWSFTETAWAFSLTILSLGISAAWAGALLPRVGPRRLAVTGSIMFAVGYMLGSLALHLENLALFCVGYGVIGGAGIGLGYVTPVATVAKWFPDKKGLAPGIVVMGFGVGAFLLSKGLAPLLVSHLAEDLSHVFLGLGVIFAVVLIPCSLLLSNPPVAAEAVAGQAHSDESDSVAPYLRSSEFVLMWIVFFFNIAAGISVISFQSELLQEVWGLADPTVEPATLGRIWGDSDRGQLALQWGGPAVLGIAIGSGGARQGLQNSARQSDGRFRHFDDRAQPLGFFRTGLLYSSVLRRGFCYHALIRARCFWPAKNVDHLWDHFDGLGGGGNLRPLVRGVSEGPESRPGDHLLLPDRDSDAGARIRVLLFVERRSHSPAPADLGGYLAPIWYCAPESG